VARSAKPGREQRCGPNGDRPNDWFRTRANLSDIPTLPFPEDQVDTIIASAAHKAAVAAIPPPAQVQSVRPVRGWAVAAAVASVAYLVSAIAAAVRSLPDIARVRVDQANGIDAAIAGHWADPSMIRLHLAVALITLVTTGLWLWKVRRNVDQIDRAGQRHRRIWTWLGWLVPIMNYWYPYQIVRDLGESSQRPKLPYRSWWAAWVIGFFFENHALSPFPIFAPQPAGLANLETYLAIGIAALAIANVLWLVILVGITTAQTQVYRLALESRPDLASGIPAQRAADLTE
jgi:hypothetical protein